MEGNPSSISLLENHEQQYGVISADITSKIGKLSCYDGGGRKQLCDDIEKLVDDGQELMEQMEIEVRDIGSNLRPKYSHRISSYKAELSRLNQDFLSVKNKHHVNFVNGNEGMYAEYGDLNHEQRQKLLDTSEHIEETGKHLATGYRITVETEELGTQILKELHGQKEKIQSSLNRVHETNADIGMSAKILSGMAKRSVQHKLILGGIATIFMVIFVVTIYNKI